LEFDARPFLGVFWPVAESRRRSPGLSSKLQISWSGLTLTSSRGVNMTDFALNRTMGDGSPIQPASRPNLDKGFNPLTIIIFFGILAAGLLFVAYSIYVDVNATGARVTTYLPYLLLLVALLIALGFEFVNGFHDTANAVATVIYTHSLPAEFAVMWSGLFNFLGVLLSSGAVAFGIVSLLPVELILQVGSSAGFAMVFALLIAAIIWNLGPGILACRLPAHTP
jgi:inorganic phosphate transporter, PiT family